MKEIQCTPNLAGLNYEDLFIHQNSDLLERFMIQKFDTQEEQGITQRIKGTTFTSSQELEEMKLYKCNFLAKN